MKTLSPLCSLNQQQAEKEAKDSKNVLDLAKQQSELEDGLSRLQTTLQRTGERATRVTAQAAWARSQAGGLEQVTKCPPPSPGPSKSRHMELL